MATEQQHAGGKGNVDDGVGEELAEDNNKDDEVSRPERWPRTDTSSIYRDG